MKKINDKVTIIGCGLVGSTSAYALMNAGITTEIVMIDIDSKRLKGEVMDLNHGISFVPPVNIRAGDYSDCKDSGIIVICAGANQKPGETRIDLLKKNVEIFKTIIPQAVKDNEDSIILVVTNPVDLLTYATLKISGLPENRVIGSGTVLDSSRFRYLISQNCNINTINVHAYIIGEHGDSEVPAWSLTNIAGSPITEYCAKCEDRASCSSQAEIFYEVKNSANAIIEGKGSTYYAVGLAVARIVKAILRNENSILPVSSIMKGNYGVSDVCLSLPSVVNSSGIVKVLDLPLNDEEVAGFRKSSEILKSHISELGL